MRVWKNSIWEVPTQNQEAQHQRASVRRMDLTTAEEFESPYEHKAKTRVRWTKQGRWSPAVSCRRLSYESKYSAITSQRGIVFQIGTIW